VRLALDSEAEGLARAARVSRLCERLVARVPDDAAGLLALARALVVLGEPASARARLDQVERVAPKSSAAAEAQVVRLAIENPSAEQEIASVLRAAHSADAESLADVAARARRLATAHGAWMGWVASAIAERRRGHWDAARRALDAAFEIAPGAAIVRGELARVMLAGGDSAGAVLNAEALLALEGPTVAALGLLARAQAAAGQVDRALETARRGLAAKPDDHDLSALLVRLREPQQDASSGTIARLWKRIRAVGRG
jgi:tetratricopeptide (TPR) repeat protein